MSNYRIQNIQPLNTDLQIGNYLVILGVGKIPPHIALLQDGILHSLKVLGYFKEAIAELLTKFNRKKLPCLFFELKEELNSAELYFSKYSRASENLSCLQPIKDCLNVKDAIYVFDLLKFLQNKNLISKTYHLNLESELDNDSYNFVKYTMADINNRIAKLELA